MIKIHTPLTKELIVQLKAGDELLLSGTIFTARDQAHKRLADALSQNKKPPLDLKSAVVYYCGPTATPKGKVIGSCGPTTSRRMDAFTPLLLKSGLKVMIGKGNRSEEVLQAIKKHGAVYLVTYAGCGALLSKCVKKAKKAAYPDLGPEAIHKLEVVDFPAIVAIDARGGNIFNTNKTRR
ncbi:MAG: FumA C-terminus/TtdB family hydratase beta subunit [Candidatus Omnitrophica bacterium]|nr:FumA C-terminus/TtdB family hydratase beta subunit [Candidatus Omnitrophota bacterium]